MVFNSILTPHSRLVPRSPKNAETVWVRIMTMRLMPSISTAKAMSVSRRASITQRPPHYPRLVDEAGSHAKRTAFTACIPRGLLLH